MSDTPLPDRENGITPATRVVRKLDPDMGHRLTVALATFGTGVSIATAGVLKTQTALTVAAALGESAFRAAPPVVAVVAGGAFAVLGACYARAIANDGDRITLKEDIKTSLPPSSIKPAGNTLG